MRMSGWLCHCLALVLLLGAPVFGAETDDAAAAAKGIVPPAAWAAPPQSPLRVLAVRGLWFDHYRIEHALARQGGAVITDSWHANSWENNTYGVRYFPTTYDGLMRQHLIIICNVGAWSFPPVTRKMLKDYVERGGAVLFLGGSLAYDPDCRESAFADFAPVEFPEKPQLRSAPDGLPLTASKDAPPSMRNLTWAASPRVYWYHLLTPKATAKTWLAAGDTPLLTTGTYGKGRVAVFAGSVMGDPAAGQMPLWDWPDWPAVLAETISWLTEPTRAPTPLDQAAMQPLTKKLLSAGVKKYADVAPALTSAVSLCRDAAGAKLLLDAAAALDDDLPLEVAETVSSIIRPYVSVDMATAATTLIESGKPGLVLLGLRVLGQAKAPEARAMLLEALRTGEPPTTEDAGTMDGEMTVDPADMQFAVRLGALEGLGNLGDASTLPDLRKFAQPLKKQLSNPEKFPAAPSREDDLYLASLLAQLRCGDTTAAGPAVDALLEHYYMLVRSMTVIDLPQYARKAYTIQQEISRLWKTYPRLRATDAILYQQLSTVPPAALPALAKRLATETTPKAVLFGFAAFGRSFRGPTFAPPPEALDALAGAKLPALADLAKSLRTK